MNHRSLVLTAILLSLFLVSSCSRASGDDEIRKIFAEVLRLQDEEEIVLKELMGRENIWLGHRLDRFPENRAELEPIAQQQIKTLSRIIDLEERQIEKLRTIQSATRDRDFLIYADLQTQIFEKRLESNRLGQQRFGFICDPNIASRKVLDEKIAEVKATQDQIDIDIQKLEQSRPNTENE